jgi:hypothetical protein
VFCIVKLIGRIYCWVIENKRGKKINTLPKADGYAVGFFAWGGQPYGFTPLFYSTEREELFMSDYGYIRNMTHCCHVDSSFS